MQLLADIAAQGDRKMLPGQACDCWLEPNVTGGVGL